MEASTTNLISPNSPRFPKRAVDNLLQVHSLTVEYCLGTATFAAVRNVSFSIASGEIVGLLGESGCGKTTTALSLLNLLPDASAVTSGSIFLGNRDLLSMSEDQLREIRGTEIAIIYQDSAVLNPVIRVGDQVAEVLRAHRRCSRKELEGKVRDLLASIGLSDGERLYNAYPHQLSGGQRQRIAIAQALICEPALVIADEPTASVDDDTAVDILSLISRMRQNCGTSFLIISHDPNALAGIASRVIVMYAGEVVENGPAEEVFSNPMHPYTRALLQCFASKNSGNRFGKEKRRFPYIPGNSPDPLEVSLGCPFADRCSDRMSVCNLSQPDLLQHSSNRLVRCFKYEVA
jgi:peptide/nickel transport system ATP-binding protein